jgi:DNA-binding YbaB/EbfC family protein|tara:strand:+ start:2201 stop:2527 length:327 start_codon:yes stop_codon:yes gene_type:complete
MFNKPNMLGMLKQAQQAKKQLKKVQKEIDRMVFKGYSNNNIVEATVNGKLQLTNLDLHEDFSALDSSNQISHIKSAVNDAISDAQKTTQEKMNAVTGGMLGDMNIPGM